MFTRSLSPSLRSAFAAAASLVALVATVLIAPDLWAAGHEVGGGFPIILR